MKSEARKKTIHKKAMAEAERREVPAKKLEAFMKRKIELDTELNDTLDDLLADFRKDLGVFIGGHLKPDPRKLEEALTEYTGKMKEILGAVAGLYSEIGGSVFKVIVHEHLIKGLDLVKAISVKVNDLQDEIDGIKRQ